MVFVVLNLKRKETADIDLCDKFQMGHTSKTFVRFRNFFFLHSRDVYTGKNNINV